MICFRSFKPKYNTSIFLPYSQNTRRFWDLHFFFFFFCKFGQLLIWRFWVTTWRKCRSNLWLFLAQDQYPVNERIVGHHTAFRAAHRICWKKTKIAGGEWTNNRNSGPKPWNNIGVAYTAPTLTKLDVLRSCVLSDIVRKLNCTPVYAASHIDIDINVRRPYTRQFFLQLVS